MKNWIINFVKDTSCAWREQTEDKIVTSLDLNKQWWWYQQWNNCSGEIQSKASFGFWWLWLADWQDQDECLVDEEGQSVQWNTTTWRFADRNHSYLLQVTICKESENHVKMHKQYMGNAHINKYGEGIRWWWGDMGFTLERQERLPDEYQRKIKLISLSYMYHVMFFLSYFIIFYHWLHLYSRVGWHWVCTS